MVDIARDALSSCRGCDMRSAAPLHHSNRHRIVRALRPKVQCPKKRAAIPFHDQQVVGELCAKIVTGQSKTGERLVELDLAQTFGVSRGPIRDAIRIFEGPRLVELLPRRGAYVRPLSLKPIADLLISASRCRCWPCGQWRQRRSKGVSKRSPAAARN